MAWGGTSSWQIYEDHFIWTTTGFDADTEETDYQDLLAFVPFLPTTYTISCYRTAGATAAVSVALKATDNTEQGSVDLITITGSEGFTNAGSTKADYTAAAGKISETACSKIKIYVTTVGAGNTLTVTLTGRR